MSEAFKKRSGIPPYKDTYKEPKPPKHEVRGLPKMAGEMLTKRLIKPVGAALLLLASFAHATTTVIGAPQAGQPANVPAVCAALASLGVTNVRCPPYQAQGNGVGDDTAAIRRALSDTVGSGGTVSLPAGLYILTDSLKLTSGVVLQGAGCSMNASTRLGTVLKVTGTHGYAAIASATPSTCTGGAGACDAAINTSARGNGCTCYSQDDCASAVCAGGTAQRGIVIRNLCIWITIDKAVGIDLLGISEADVSDVFISTNATGATDVTGVRLSDANGILSGYSNVLHNMKILADAGGAAMKIGIHIMAQANNASVRDVRIIGNIGEGIHIQRVATGGSSAAANVHLEDNAVESTTTNGIFDEGVGTQLSGNYCENGAALAVPCLHLGAQAKATQLLYNFYTPSTLSDPQHIDGGAVNFYVDNRESNFINTGQWSNINTGFKWADFAFSNRGAAPATCTNARIGRLYDSSGQHTVCRCDSYGGVFKWCPVACDSTPACPGAFVCGAGQTASTCG